MILYIMKSKKDARRKEAKVRWRKAKHEDICIRVKN